MDKFTLNKKWFRSSYHNRKLITMGIYDLEEIKEILSKKQDFSLKLLNERYHSISYNFRRETLANSSYCCCFCKIQVDHFKVVRFSFKTDDLYFLAFAKDNRYFTVEHIIPKHKGGTLDPMNLKLSCNICNTIRGKSTCTPLGS